MTAPKSRVPARAPFRLRGASAASALAAAVTLVAAATATTPTAPESGSARSASYTIAFHGFAAAGGPSSSSHYQLAAAISTLGSDGPPSTNGIHAQGGPWGQWNLAPQARDARPETAEDTPLILELAGSDPDGDPLQFQIVQAPTHGTLSGTAPRLLYVPAADYHGEDTLQFSTRDATDTSAPATLRILVTPVNDPPRIVGPSDLVANPSTNALRIPIQVADPDSEAVTLRLTASSSSTSVIPQAALTIEGTGTNRTLVVAFAGGSAGSTRIGVEARDAEGATQQVNFLLSRPPIAPTAVTPLPTVAGFSLSAAAVPGVYRVDASEDLRAWFLLDLIDVRDGTFRLLDPASRTRPARFYRIRSDANPLVPMQVHLAPSTSGLDLTAHVEAGAYRIETSPDVVAWQLVGRTNVNAGTLRWPVGRSTNSPVRFFRVVRE